MKRILVLFLMLAIILWVVLIRWKVSKILIRVYQRQNQMNKIASKVQNTIKTDIVKQEDSNTHVYKDGKSICYWYLNYIKIVKKCIISHMK